MLHDIIVDAYYHGSHSHAHGPCCAMLNRESGLFSVSIWDSTVDLANVRPESLDFFADDAVRRTPDGLCRCGGNHARPSVPVPHGIIFDDEEI